VRRNLPEQIEGDAEKKYATDAQSSPAEKVT
jgi:hypothetical protein